MSHRRPLQLPVENRRRPHIQHAAGAFVALLVAALLLAVPPAGVNAGDAASSLQVTLTAMQLMGCYSTFLDLLTVSGVKYALPSLLSGTVATILAPTDMAFSDLPRLGLTVAALKSQPARLRELLLAHVIVKDARCSVNFMKDKLERKYPTLACNGDGVPIVRVDAHAFMHSPHLVPNFTLPAAKQVYLSLLGGQPTVMHRFDDVSTSIVVHGIRLVMVPGAPLPCWRTNGSVREAFGLPPLAPAPAPGPASVPAPGPAAPSGAASSPQGAPAPSARQSNASSSSSAPSPSGAGPPSSPSPPAAAASPAAATPTPAPPPQVPSRPPPGAVPSKATPAPPAPPAPPVPLVPSQATPVPPVRAPPPPSPSQPPPVVHIGPGGHSDVVTTLLPPAFQISIAPASMPLSPLAAADFRPFSLSDAQAAQPPPPHPPPPHPPAPHPPSAPHPPLPHSPSPTSPSSPLVPHPPPAPATPFTVVGSFPPPPVPPAGVFAALQSSPHSSARPSELVPALEGPPSTSAAALSGRRSGGRKHALEKALRP